MSFNLWRCLVAIILLLYPFSAALAAQNDLIEASRARLNLSYESLDLDDDENLGLLGGSLLFDRNSWFSLGPGFYGAVDGDRGGFITLGLGAEARVPLTDLLKINAGAFVGAGGGRGGLELTGGGLMLRTHLGLQIDGGRWGNFAAGVSYIDFPDGSIDSVQPFILYQYPIKAWVIEGWHPQGESLTVDAPVFENLHEFALVFRHYAVSSGVSGTNGRPQEDIELVGVEWQRYLSDRFFLKVETEGAAGGDSSGYMQILLGGGARLGLTDSTAIKLAAGLGPAGGGGVDTGGGLIADVFLGLQQDISDSLYLEAGGGYLKAVDGDFEAASLGVKLGYRFGTPDPLQDRVPRTDLAAFSSKAVRWRLAHQTYFKADNRWRNNHADRDIQLLGFQADYWISDPIYLTGQALAAYEGKAGAYMTGLVGAGLQLPLWKSPLFVEVEGLVGAAGGGGVDTGSGLVLQANGGIGCRLGKNYSLIVSYGHIAAVDGDFQAHVLGIALAHRLTIFAR